LLHTTRFDLDSPFNSQLKASKIAWRWVMFGRKRSATSAVAETAAAVSEAVADAADAAIEYVDPLVKDERLREKLATAIVAGAAARNRMRKQTGLIGLARRLAADQVLRAQLAEMAVALDAAQKRAKKARGHRRRNTILFVSGVGMTVAAIPALRSKVRSIRGGGRDDQWAPSRRSEPKQTTIEEEIEVAVPVSTAYNQWTQFEEFPRFMDGVEEVRQLDDTLLHWAANVAGKRAEWDAQIIEQEPGRRITWESTDGKHTRGTVSFEEAGAGRSRIQLRMSYTPEGVTEMVGSAVGLDNRRIRGDLQRFRGLIEDQRVEAGAWRGEVHAGTETQTNPASGNQ
jgi:uncharacterized membrane protein